MHHIKAPNAYKKKGVTIFLAGSIEMGKASRWQENVVHKMREYDGTLLNPRRDDWDESWRYDSPEFKRQVHWELDAQESADHILMFYESKTRSPITLLELGLLAHTGKMIVVCDESFWRYGNVHIVCERYKIPHFNDLDIALEHLTEII